MRQQFEICPKLQFFEFSWWLLRLEWDRLNQKRRQGGYERIRDKVENSWIIPPGKMGLFHI